MTSNETNVLLIEDNPADARLLEELLRGASHIRLRLQHAQTLAAGLDHLEHNPVDAVLLDLSLPDSVGLETLRVVCERHPDIAVVVLTGYADEEIGLEALRQGAMDFLVKGVTDGTVISKVLRFSIERMIISLERDAALAAREASEQRYRALYDHTPAIFLTVTPAGDIVSVNAFGAQYLGYAVHDLIGAHVSKLAAGNDLSLLDYDNDVGSGDEPNQLRWSVNRADGKRLMLRASIRKLSARESHNLLVVCEDITQADVQERFLSAVLDNIRDGVVACDAAGFLTTFNRAARELFNLDGLEGQIPPSEWVERFGLYKSDGVTRPHETELTLYRALMGEVVRDSEVVLAPTGVAKRRVLCSGQAMHDSDGNKLGAVISMHDITESRHVQQQLQQAQKMEAVGQLTGGLAHDFNNLLAIILGNLQLIERTLPSELADAVRQCKAAKEAALRGSTLTRQLLAFARNQTLEAKLVDAADLIVGMQPLLESTVGEQVAVHMHLDKDPWQVRVDSSILESSLLNLAINARDAMHDGGVLSIQLENVCLTPDAASTMPDVKPGDFVMIAVSDTGCGMSKVLLDRVVEPFFTTKEVGKGSGLGLSMVYGFVKQSGGYIRLYSEVGRGTVVRLYLPRAYARETGDTMRIRTIEPSPARGSEVILAVEDDPSLRKVTQTLLENLGYKVLIAASGADAAKKLASRSDIDLVFSDVVMPGGMSGIDLLRHIRESYPEIRVVLTSGFTKTTVLDDSTELDDIYLLPKPYGQNELGKVIRQVLDEADAA